MAEETDAYLDDVARKGEADAAAAERAAAHARLAREAEPVVEAATEAVITRLISLVMPKAEKLAAADRADRLKREVVEKVARKRAEKEASRKAQAILMKAGMQDSFTESYR